MVGLMVTGAKTCSCAPGPSPLRSHTLTQVPGTSPQTKQHCLSQPVPQMDLLLVWGVCVCAPMCVLGRGLLLTMEKVLCVYPKGSFHMK